MSAWESFSQAAQFLVMLTDAAAPSPPPTCPCERDTHHDYYGTTTTSSQCPTINNPVTQPQPQEDVAAHWHWLDCSPTLEAAFWQDDTSTSTTTSCSSKEGSTPFLFMRVIAISQASHSSTSILSLSIPILSNLALCCTILGTRLGEQPGRGFLEMAHDLYQKVQGLLEQIEPCSSISSFYSSSTSTTTTTTASSSSSASPHGMMMMLLSMAIANNCACIYFTSKSMPHATMLECLHRLATMLEGASPILGLLRAQDRGDFLLNLQILTTSHTVAAAA